VGQLLVTSRNKVYVYVMFDGKQLRLSGTFSAVAAFAVIEGPDENREEISVKIVQQ